MGAWGTAIFSDDTACDIQDEFRDLIADGCSEEDATEILIRKWEYIFNEEYNTVFWLALAATQWKLGRLQEDIKLKAITIIESGENLVLWKDSQKDLKKRQAVLEKLKNQLESPQCPPKKVKKRYYEITPFKPGEIVSYQLLSGQFVLLRVLELCSDNKVSFPLFGLCDWVGTDVPSIDALDKIYSKLKTHFMVMRLSQRDFPETRLKVVAAFDPPAEQKWTPFRTLFWSDLDEFLSELYIS